MNSLRVALVGSWAILSSYTIRAISSTGITQAGPTYFGDLQHPWRGQFNVDFLCYLSLIAIWITYREKHIWRGLLFAMLEFTFGNMFLAPYLIVESFRVNGDISLLLTGYNCHI